MDSPWVPNASPVIALAKVGRLHLLYALGGRVLLPDAVAYEILMGPPGDPGRAAVAANWGQRCSPVRTPEAVLEWGLGAGESAVLATGLERGGATAVLDDASGRTAARSLGLRLIGILGVVVRAKRLGLLLSAAPVFADLAAAGFFLDDAVIRTSLRQAGDPIK